MPQEPETAPIVMALDVGLKRVGAAVTDQAGLTAQPLTVLSRKPHGLFLENLSALIAERGVALLVLGLPRRTTGELGPEAQRVLSLAHELRTKLNVKVETFDERLTTVAAERVLEEGGLDRRARRKVVDKTAAAIILQGHLAARDARRESKET
jgi:putative Holliday junction resolvase